MEWTTCCKVGDIACCSLPNDHKSYFTWVSNVNKFPKNRASLKKYIPHNITLKASQDYTQNIFDMIHILHISSVVKIRGSVEVPHIFRLSTRWQWAISIILHPPYCPAKSTTHYTGEKVSSAAGTYIVANQRYPDAKLSHSDQEHPVRINAVSFGTYHHFGKWKLKLQVPP